MTFYKVKFYLLKGWRYDVAYGLVHVAWLMSGKTDYHKGSKTLAYVANKLCPGGCIPDTW